MTMQLMLRRCLGRILKARSRKQCVSIDRQVVPQQWVQVYKRNATAVYFLVAPLIIVPGVGCKTIPPPSPTEIQVQALDHLDLAGTWKAGDLNSGAVSDNWLATFNDEQLNALVKEALENNLDLQVAASRVEQAAGYVDVAKSALYPAVNLFGSRRVSIRGGGSELSTPIQLLALGVSWEPDIWGRVRYARNASQEDYTSAKADFEFARQSLAAHVARSWFMATQTWLQHQLVEEIIQAAQELVRIAEKRLEVGIGTEQDVSTARANLGNLKDTSKQIVFAHEQSLRALELLLGRYPAAEIEARHDLPALPGLVPAGMRLDILERRPDIIAAERRVAAAFNRVAEAKAARLPQIPLTGDIGIIDAPSLDFKVRLPRIALDPESVLPDKRTVEIEKEIENPTGGIDANMLFPIFRGGALKANVTIRNAAQRESISNYARTVLVAMNEVESALGTSSTLAERETLLRQVVSDSQRALDLAMTNYRIGTQDLRLVQLQQMDLHAARITLLLVQTEQLIQRANLHLALGGSFEANPSVQ